MPEFSPTIRIASIMLKEPSKEIIYALGDKWEDTNLPDREAIASIFDKSTNRALTIIINLTEHSEVEQTVANDPEFKSLLKELYGVNDTSLVMVDAWSAGYYGAEEEKNKRLVIRIEKFGKWDLSPNSTNYAFEKLANFRSDIKPLHILQPEGSSFTRQGYQISWQKWDFVVGFNIREGLTIHQVQYQDKNRKRSILFRGSLDEMVVPYGDSTPTQRRKNAFDVGEYGMGMMANSLRKGYDCLGPAEYLDFNFCDSYGNLVTIQNAISVYEEDSGILWKHTDRRFPDSPELRRSRRLVVFSMSTAGNYEYGFFWYFYQDGTIQFEVKLTGILSAGAAHKGENPKWGTMMSPLVYAPNHQHIFNVRLDFDIEGMNNTVQQSDIVADPLDEEENPFENAFHVSVKDLKTEKEARANLCLETGRSWKIVNNAKKNYMGQPVGYKFYPGENAVPFASPNSWWRKRAGFVNYHVWVTPYNEDEKFAAGDFPNQNQGGDGLIKWTEQNRSIENKDVVFWYTFGHTHIPRLEDYPIMPTASIGFTLKPNGFFDANPSLDVPPPPVPNKNGKLNIEI
uniref:Amine oxidase n=1 Tax=Acrobeloides nanus TaxID=290746 RepID=A0A914D430_9BILA